MTPTWSGMNRFGIIAVSQPRGSLCFVSNEDSLHGGPRRGTFRAPRVRTGGIESKSGPIRIGRPPDWNPYRGL